MTSVVQDIQVIRSLRNNLREVKVPSNILNAIESIHNCIKSGTDLGGWKKVEWRGGSNNSKGTVSTHRSVQGSYKSGNNNFFNNRSESSSSNLSTSSTYYAFSNRPKNGFSGRQTVEQQVSIPLTDGVNNISTTTATATSSSVASITSDGFRTPPHKYVSKFKKNSDNLDDKILNTIILGKLNKFSELNYDEIKEFITHIIDSGQTDMIKCFMKLVFEKAASEEMFCPLYAKLLSELSSRYPVLLTEMKNLYSVYIGIFEEVQESSAENYNEVCKRNVEKKYRRGYSQFLAELIKHDVIDIDIFMKTIIKIITHIENNIKNKDLSKLNEEYADCLMKIMKAIEEDNSNDSDDSDSSDSYSETDRKIIKIRETLKNETSKRIQPLTVRNSENIGISNKARFTFLDIFEGIQKF